MTFGERLLRLRTGLKLSREGLAARVGITARSVENYEKDSSVPDLNVLTKLANELNTSISYLVGESESPSKEDRFTDLREQFSDLPEGEFQKIVDTPLNALFLQRLMPKPNMTREELEDTIRQNERLIIYLEAVALREKLQKLKADQDKKGA